MFAAMMLGGAEVLLLLALVMAPLAILGMVFWIWMLIHAIQNKGLNDTERLVWVLVILFAHFLGALIYFAVGRARRTLAPAT
jgi:hypothetical protein